MKKLLLGVLIGGLAVAGWNRFHRPVAVIEAVGDSEAEAVEVASDMGESEVVEPAAKARFRCDGRTRCSQMTSCEEAKFFLENCPGVKMDGEGDGIPCERQWCTNR